ncbi:hypothetical protein ACFQ60_31010 [Streptomyces zhihengii]
MTASDNTGQRTRCGRACGTGPRTSGPRWRSRARTTRCCWRSGRRSARRCGSPRRCR